MIFENGIQIDYISRVNKALQLIDENPDTDLTLENVSKAGFYSRSIESAHSTTQQEI